MEIISFTLLLVLVGVVSGFCLDVISSSSRTRPSTLILFDGDGTGGWGIGGQRKITEEEFVRGDRRYFDGYKMNEPGDFLVQIEQEKEDLDKAAMNELLGVANFAGLTMKDPSKRLNKFDDTMLLDDDDDELDLSV